MICFAFLNDVKINNETVKDRLIIYSTPYPFNNKTNVTRRTKDVSLIKSLYYEHIPKGYSLKE